jgi:hypothetical protein
MKVEILEERLSSKDRGVDPPRLIVAEKGDIVTVSDTCGEHWCAAGWAKDVLGKVETGERVPGARRLRVDGVKMAPKKAGG